MNELPSFLAYSSFLLGFLGFQIIPGYSYKEYEKFMKGKHLVPFRKPMATSKKLDLQEEKYPSPNWMVLTNLPVALAYGYMLRILMPYFSYQFMSDDRFVERFSFLFKLAYCVPCGFMFRLRFYFAWKLGQSIYYAAGFGFSGWTEDGKEQWELVRNGELTRVESCSNWKELWDTWNNMTSKWLRFICYSRIQNKSAAAAITFLFSAMWHGFHPGYYIQFAHSYLFVLVGRKIRKTIWPHFQDSYFKKIMYNCVTWVGCQLSMCYAIIPMSELQLSSTFVIFRSLYFYMSWIAIFLLIVLQPKRPVKSLQLSGTSEDQRQKVDDRKRECNESRKKK
ncbi:lysophospholipid acyltransferase 1-like [Symsagittifera roscoffensis]|uniref:lysophospholipid acyltransferase 1-like n=1 Tax=Symsagittifera roscoffensis TaxID=84072 RepID=UPI00307BE729